MSTPGYFDKAPRILIVEDSLTQAEQLRYFLQEHGYVVAVAYNGAEALRVLPEFKPEIVISDVVMPGMDGYTLCQQIKNDRNLRDLRVVLLTSLSDPVDIIRGLNCGADNFLTKPYNEEMLLSRLMNIQVNSEMRRHGSTQIGMEIFFAGQRHFLSAERVQIVDLLLATYENAIQKSRELEESHRELRKAYETISMLEVTYRSLLESNADGMLVIGQDGAIRYANPAAEVLFRNCGESLVGSQFNYPIFPDETREITIACPDGMECVAEMRVVRTSWEREEAFLASLRDVTDSVLLREQLSNLSLTDELTGLYNRRGFQVLGEQRRKEADLHRTGFSLLFLDIDDMKTINDTFGHAAGDQSITDTADLLCGAVRESDIVARIAGDEFAVLTIETTPTGSGNVLNRLQSALEAHNAQGERPYRLSISIGVAHYDPKHPCALDELIHRADSRMYEVKQAKKVSR